MGVFDDRLEGGIVEGEKPALSSRVGRLAPCFLSVWFRDTLETAPILDQERIGVGGVDYVFGKLSLEEGDLEPDGTQLLLVRGREVGFSPSTEG